jgi:hypothetical protein
MEPKAPNDSGFVNDPTRIFMADKLDYPKDVTDRLMLDVSSDLTKLPWSGEVVDLQRYRADDATIRSMGDGFWHKQYINDAYALAKKDGFERRDIERLGLTRQEIGAMYSYNTLSGHRVVNNALRGMTSREAMFTEDIAGHHVDQRVIQDSIKVLASGLNKLPQWRGNVFRVAKFASDHPLANIKPGQVMTEPAFLSSTRSEVYRDGLATLMTMGLKKETGTTGVVYTIIAKNGRRLSFRNNPQEDEVVFLPGSRFRVTSTEFKPTWLGVDVLTVTMEQL